MHRSLADKARARRRAVLSTLKARLAEADNVVSLFEEHPRPSPAQRSLRPEARPRAARRLPVLVLGPGMVA